MPSRKSNDSSQERKAEDAYRRAFTRLKEGTSTTLPAGSSVSQNNVAREAGSDPSALKKSRFPSLVAEIQEWIASNSSPNEQSENNIMARNRGRELRRTLSDLKAQRDMLASLLVEADAKILELSQENDRLRSLLPASNVTRIRGQHRGTP